VGRHPGGIISLLVYAGKHGDRVVIIFGENFILND